MIQLRGLDSLCCWENYCSIFGNYLCDIFLNVTPIFKCVFFTQHNSRNRRTRCFIVCRWNFLAQWIAGTDFESILCNRISQCDENTGCHLWSDVQKGKKNELIHFVGAIARVDYYYKFYNI